MNEKLLEYFKSDDIHLIQCEHKWCNAYGYEKSQMKKDLIDYITNLQQENEKLKYNARGQVNDYFKDKYADEVLKNAELQQDLDKANDIIEKDRQFYKCRMDEYVELKKENEKLKNFITNLISELNHCELNRTKKLDIVSDYIKQEYEKVLNGSDEK